MSRLILLPCPFCGEVINYAVIGVDIARSGFGSKLQGQVSVESDHRCVR